MRTFLRFGWLWLFCCAANAAFAQADFFELDHLPEINLLFEDPNWDETLDSLFLAGDEGRMVADVEIDGTLLGGVGVRYKGFSSVSVDRDKNPFNIKLNYTHDSLNYQGVDKVKLANVIQDPSFVREVLSYQSARRCMPSGRANFAKVFINGQYWGLYTNTEAVDKQFLERHHWTTTGPFFKAAPENLDLFGENANLSDSPGEILAPYLDLYDLKSETGWVELFGFIQSLNNAPEQIELVLDVDRTLWMHALNYALVNFDSYVGYAQNYYLYADHHGRFQPIPWDMNMSFASFRLTDASEYFDGFSIEEAKTLDPLTHLNNVSVFPRPLIRNVLENETHRRMYMAHLRAIVVEDFVSGAYIEEANALRTLIEPWVELDTNKFYGFDDFQDNLDSTVSDLVDYPGIVDLMTDRANHLMGLTGMAEVPTISEVDLLIPLEFGGEAIVGAMVDGADEVRLYYRFGEDAQFEWVPMNWAFSGQHIAVVENAGNVFEYYIYAESETAGRFSPDRAAYVFYREETSLPMGTVAINECMSNSLSGATDGDGDVEDWIELHNLTATPICLGGLYLSDSLEWPFKWALPDAAISPHGHVMVWADEEGSEGKMHANFRLSSMGETVLLSDSSGNIWDETTLPESPLDEAWARFPNGTGPFGFLDPTPGWENGVVTLPALPSLEPLVYPNPSMDQVHFVCPSSAPWTARFLSLRGEQLSQSSGIGKGGSLRISDFPSGTYVLQLEQDGWTTTHLIQHP
jgi:hypothetical protein